MGALPQLIPMSPLRTIIALEDATIQFKNCIDPRVGDRAIL